MKAMVALACAGMAVCCVTVVEGAELPLSRVVLFSSGVGFFFHEGMVENNAEIPMSFRVSQINDILKSMVLQDLGGGTIGPVTYAPQDPLERTLKSFAVDISADPSLGELLGALRGARLEVKADKVVTGTILGVEWQKKSVGENILEFEVINLVTEEGIVGVPVWQAKSVRLLDEALQSDLNKALAAIATNRDVSKRQVRLSFKGNGKRQVSVGYLLETPVWKTTYRLVADEGESFLQGWAIVENTTETDWEAVGLSLVSGQPISFVQDLYEPLYTQRPEVPVQVQGAARPVMYEGAMAEAEEQVADGRAATRELRAAAPMAPPALAGAAAMARGAAGAGGPGMGMMMADAFKAAGVTAAAAGAEVGELFHYEITQPVDIGRQSSAMIPIVTQAIKAEKLSIYNESTNAVHPMNGLRLTNTTGLQLMAGPITVFDGGAYAGDALMANLARDEERLISYAVDLGVEVAPKVLQSEQSESSMKIVRGTLILTYRMVVEKEYAVKNRTDEARSVLIEYPVRDEWKLIAPEKPTETTRSLYRLKVAVAPDKTEKLVVKEERALTETVMLTNESIDRIGIYIRSRTISEKVKAALQQIVDKKAAIAVIERQIAEKEERLKQIGTEQERIRQNMEQLDHESELYRKYVAKLTAQEDEFDKIRGEVAQAKAERDRLQKELNDFISKLSVE